MDKWTYEQLRNQLYDIRNKRADIRNQIAALNSELCCVDPANQNRIMERLNYLMDLDSQLGQKEDAIRAKLNENNFSMQE